MSLLDRISTPSPEVESRINGFFALVMGLLIIPSVLWWGQSLVWIVFLSIWTAFRTEMTLWMASRVKVKQEQDSD